MRHLFETAQGRPGKLDAHVAHLSLDARPPSPRPREGVLRPSHEDTGLVVEVPDGPAHVRFACVHEIDAGAHPLRSEEEAQLGSRAVPRRRMDFRLGRAAARAALEALGVGDAPVLRGPDGGPVWPPGVVGAITHAAGYGLAAAAYRDRSGGVGLDLEELRAFPGLVEQIAVDEERRWLKALHPRERDRAAMELFSAKESVYKAFAPRVGRFFGFEAVRLEPGPDRRHYAGRFVTPPDPAYPPDRTFRIAVRWFGPLVLTSLVLPPDEGGRQDPTAPGASPQ